MSGQLDDNEERRLREILRTEVDSVQPSGDGLQRIQERTAQRGMSWMAWLRPAAAVAGALAIVATVLFGAPALREQITTLNTNGEAGPAQTESEPTTDSEGDTAEDHTPEGGATDTPDEETDDPPVEEEPTTAPEEEEGGDTDPTLLEDCPVDDPTLAHSPNNGDGQGDEVPEHCSEDSEETDPQDVDDPTTQTPGPGIPGGE